MQQHFEILPQIVDAFSMNPLFYRPYLPYRYFMLQLQRMETLRRAASQGTYRMRQFVTPLSTAGVTNTGSTQPGVGWSGVWSGGTVPALGTSKQQVRITPGSYIWALTFCDFEMSANALGIAVGAITDFNVTLADHDTGMEFFSGSVSGGLSNFPLLQLLDEPRPVLGSGQIDITLVNRINAARTPQLVISCAEPCVVATEGA